MVLFVVLVAIISLGYFLKKENLVKYPAMMLLAFYAITQYLGGNLMFFEGDGAVYSVFVFLAFIAFVGAFACFLIPLFLENLKAKKMFGFIVLFCLMAFILFSLIAMICWLVVAGKYNGLTWYGVMETLGTSLCVPAAFFFGYMHFYYRKEEVEEPQVQLQEEVPQEQEEEPKEEKPQD